MLKLKFDGVRKWPKAKQLNFLVEQVLSNQISGEWNNKFGFQTANNNVELV